MVSKTRSFCSLSNRPYVSSFDAEDQMNPSRYLSIMIGIDLPGNDLSRTKLFSLQKIVIFLPGCK